MAVVVRELVLVAPKKIWPHNTFSQITANTYGELMSFCKKIGLAHDEFVNMRFHPHFKIETMLFDQALACGATPLSKQAYDSFVSQNHI